MPWTAPLGRLVEHIRTGHTVPSADLRVFLDEHGFLYSCRNLAVHVAARRCISVGDLRSIPIEELTDDFSALQQALQKLQHRWSMRAWWALSAAGLRERFVRALQAA